MGGTRERFKSIWTYVKTKGRYIKTNIDKLIIKEEEFKEEKYIETHIKVGKIDYYVRFTNHQGLSKGIHAIMRNYGYELKDLKVISSRTHKRRPPVFKAYGFKL